MNSSDISTFVDWVPKTVQFRDCGVTGGSVQVLSANELAGYQQYATKTKDFSAYIERVVYCARSDGIIVFRLHLKREMLEYVDGVLLGTTRLDTSEKRSLSYAFLYGLLNNLSEAIPANAGSGRFLRQTVLERLTSRIAIEVTSVLKAKLGHNHCFHQPNQSLPRDDFLSVEPVRLYDSLETNDPELIEYLATLPSKPDKSPEVNVGLGEFNAPFESESTDQKILVASLHDIELDQLVVDRLISVWPAKSEELAMTVTSAPMVLFERFANVREDFV